MTGESTELLNKFKKLDNSVSSQIEIKKSIFSRHPKLKVKQFNELKAFFNK